MKTPLFILLIVAFVAPACAEPVTVPIGRVRLLDGRTLTNAVVRSYDPEASKVLVVANGNVVLIPISLLPPPFPEKIKAASARAADLVQTTPAPASVAPAAPDPRVTTTSSPTPIVQPSPAPQVPAPVAPVASPADERRAHRDVARTHVLRYYKYEFRTGSNAISVTDSDVAIDETEPVPGWLNRFRTTGKVYLEIYESVGGGSFRRSSHRFEILTEQKPGEEIKVVDFTRK